MTAAWPRRVLRLTAVTLVLLSGVAFALVATGLGDRGRIRLAGAWSRLLLRAIGVRVEARQGFTFLAGSATGPRTVRMARGRIVPASGYRSVPAAGPDLDPPGRGSPQAAPLFVANHVSWLDPLVMVAAQPCHLLAKRDVLGWPVIGVLATVAGVFFIDRERLSALPVAVSRMAAALAGGHAVAAFPEGTTWCGRKMGTFRPAVFQAALDAGAPVRPVALRYLGPSGTPATASAFVGDDTLWASVRRVVAIRRLTVEVTVLPEVRGDDRRALAWAAESSVASVVVVGAAHDVPVAA
ncbi:1-acyl-sn-glycerol-3-phosphate acyltransferase [Streptosporangium becharense]|uniref:1-acyl-sn-glycerol-3-phosphate acyltransferase n=1 Tax=Streptosporangium becharense TaxID=1816182 RepID=A0A7W9MH31_9ACTN|nr:lysophospholipid acyltransferase family protein [Streptosporangium becharense]MBB2908979.1 1-acyl-sn-glycerol-3-phosphate acyltransferase [Streptosporangium becharense]MBB5820003.1 1-acyl-sn-glycerol-3-phosphate acyltransferase [Streptosporangium becharense]